MLLSRRGAVYRLSHRVNQWNALLHCRYIDWGLPSPTTTTPAHTHTRTCVQIHTHTALPVASYRAKDQSTESKGGHTQLYANICKILLEPFHRCYLPAIEFPKHYVWKDVVIEHQKELYHTWHYMKKQFYISHVCSLLSRIRIITGGKFEVFLG